MKIAKYCLKTYTIFLRYLHFLHSNITTILELLHMHISVNKVLKLRKTPHVEKHNINGRITMRDQLVVNLRFMQIIIEATGEARTISPKQKTIDKFEERMNNSNYKSDK
uniref:Uncharacterized protein n=1 Tax=Rhizophagus irregularis (strain DAOM 181602 / DAOM 197198 / MUCL 43194) TaxID=747089 RepID=U9U3L0_RHIID